MINFPPLRVAVLSALSELKNDLSVLDAEQCPYDEETKQLLKDLLAPKLVDNVVVREVVVGGGQRGRPSKDIKLDAEDQKMVFDEIKEQIKKLKDLESGKDVATNERIQIAKTKSNLLDQLLKMMERHTTVMKMESFKEEVIKILNDLVSEADRELFLKRIDAHR